MNRAIVILAVVVPVAFLVPNLGGRQAAAVAATPTPAALQYDEINRVVLPPATPPPPGSFADDYAAAMASASASSGQSGQHHGGLGGMLGSIMGGGGPGPGAAGMMGAMGPGRVVRYTYYKGWIRTDDLAAQTATIEKCAEHQYVTLNLAAKTYTIANTQPPCPPAMSPMGRPTHVSPEMSAPGTVDMTIKNTGQDLGPMTIDAVATTGSQNTMEMSMSNATGSCRNADVGMNVTQYISQIPVPRAYCPLPRSIASTPAEMMGSQGGCKPTMHAAGTGMAWMEGALGRLVIYRRSAMSGGESSRMGGINMVVERGNVKWLSGAPADALFEVPPGFTQAG